MKNLLTLVFFIAFCQLSSAQNKSITGFFKQNTGVQLGLESQFDNNLSTESIDNNIKQLSAVPHHLGSKGSKDNAEYILNQFKSYGWNAEIETFHVLFPTPKKRVLEMTAPTSFKATLQELAVKEDPYSEQKGQLPPYNAFSADGDVTAGLVFVNYGLPDDYETLEKMGVDLHYGKFFPSFYFSQKLNANNTIQFSYSRRIDRPTFNELAPFVVLMTPETFVSGNANLLPAFSNVVRSDYQFKSFVLSLSYTDTKNAIARFQPTNSEDSSKVYYISKNLDRVQNFSATLTLPIIVTDWWKMQNNFAWNWQRLTTKYEDANIDYKQNYYTFNSSQSFSLNDYFSAEITGFYRSKSLEGIAIQKPLGRVDVGIQWKLKDKNSRFNLNVTDIFKTMNISSEANIPELNIYNSYELNFDSRVLRLTFTHNFGNEAVKVRKRNTGSEEEQNRIQAN